ncbi:MAG: zinc-ribbon domain-containing protein [Gemmatales bacterium]|nr:zinc-ribbon domain-containing protein [Gemmatales bacterium]MDW8386413.1 hypothetical protein [Gemmatales bacterium]
MAIKFSCPSCKKALAVKDDLAGKQGRCPNCKQVIVIPTAEMTGPEGRPANPAVASKPAKKSGQERKSPSGSKVDLESLAAEVLVEKKQEAPAEPQTVTFTCPWCDSEVTYGAELAGKQAPCTNPECRRIIKIPALQKTEPRDWRKPEQSTLPSGARRDDAPLEGAWGSQHASGASREALIEAKVIQEREPITVRGWILRGAAAASVLLVIAAGVYFVLSYRSAGREAEALALAQAGLNDGTGPAGEPWLHLGLAEYSLRANKRNESGYSLALYHTQQASNAVATFSPDSLGKALALAEILSLQQKAMTMPPQEDEPKGERDEWAGQFSETLNQLPATPARFAILRALIRQRLSLGPSEGDAAVEQMRHLLRQSFRPVPVAKAAPEGGANQPAGAGQSASQTADNDYSEQINALAVVAQELVAAGKTDAVGPWVKELRGLYKPDHPLPVELVALLTALNQAELEAMKEGEPAQIGRFLGMIRAGRNGEAERYLNEHLQQSTTPLKLSALLDAAEVLGPQQGEVASRMLREAARILHSHAPGELIWDRYRFVLITAQVEGIDAAESVLASVLAEPDASHARAALVKLRCETSPGSTPKVPDDVQQAQTTNEAQAHLVLVTARCLGKADPDGALSWAKSLQSPRLRGVAAVGVLLASQDRGTR